MAIRYVIPQVAAQKGPTCWYYTMKMLLRFHNQIAPGQALEAGWKQLHIIRQVMTELAEEKVDRTKTNVADRLTKWMNLEVDGTRRATLRTVRTKIQNAASVERFAIVTEFLPGVIQPVALRDGDAYDPTFIEWALTNHGPLYASIYHLGGGYFDRDYVEDPLEPGKYIYKLDHTAQVGGRHAICIAGIDDDANVYFNDPNCPHRFTMIAWDVIKDQMNSPGGTMGANLFGAVACVGCTHLGNHI